MLRELKVNQCQLSESHTGFLTIKFCYNLAKVSHPQRIMAHSSKAQSQSSVFLRNASIVDICKGATWLSVPSFSTHYPISQASHDYANFGKSVLQSVQMTQRPFTCKRTVDESTIVQFVHSHSKEKRMVTLLCRNCCSLRCAVHIHIPQPFHLSRYFGHYIQRCDGTDREAVVMSLLCPYLIA